MLNKNAVCIIRKVTGTDVYGQRTLGTSVSEPCAVVKLKKTAQHTTVRADSSGSKGYAEEFSMFNRVHLDKSTSAAIGDQLTVHGQVIRIMSMQPRFDVLGPLDYYEVEGEPWPA